MVFNLGIPKAAAELGGKEYLIMLFGIRSGSEMDPEVLSAMDVLQTCLANPSQWHQQELD